MNETRTTVEVQGPMPFPRACQLEDDLLREHMPRFNKSIGWKEVGATNPIADRIRRECYLPRKVAIRISEEIDPAQIDEEIASRKRALWGSAADDLDLSKSADRKVLLWRKEEHAARLDELRAAQITA